MPENDRPLPTPPRSRFGRRLPGEGENEGALTADRLTQAAAEGRLEEILQHEIPEGEHARNLALMMLGMSGLMPPGMPGTVVDPSSTPSSPPETAGARASVEAPARPEATGSAVPPEVLAATMEGDVAGLMSLLQAEHARRSGEGSPGGEAPASVPPSAAGVAVPLLAAAEAAAAPRAGIDQALVDELIRIAAENQVTVDWLLLRAVKLYIEEHRRTGRL